MEQTGQALEERREQRREAKRRAAEKQREQARIERRCKELRASVENLVQNRQLLTSDGEGGYERLPEEQRKERLAKRREEFRETCES